MNPLKPRPNQKLIDEAKIERQEIFIKMKEVSSNFKDGYISTQELANIIYPNGPFYNAPFKTSKKYKINVNGDLLLSRLKRMTEEGLIESKKDFGKRLWRIKILNQSLSQS